MANPIVTPRAGGRAESSDGYPMAVRSDAKDQASGGGGIPAGRAVPDEGLRRQIELAGPLDCAVPGTGTRNWRNRSAALEDRAAQEISNVSLDRASVRQSQTEPVVVRTSTDRMRIIAQFYGRGRS